MPRAFNLRTFALASVAAALLAACNRSGLEVIVDAGPAPLDNGPPGARLSTCPTDGTQDVGTNSAVVVHGAAPIDPVSVAGDSLVLRVGDMPVAGSISADGDTLKIIPQASLPPHSTVTVTLSGQVRDVRGQPLMRGGSSWSFQTGNGPTREPFGFHYSPPQSPISGQHAISFDVTLDDTRPILAWTTPVALIATSLVDGSFTPSVQIEPPQQFDVGPLTMTARGGTAHVAWIVGEKPFINYTQGTDDWTGTPTVQQIAPPPGYYAHTAEMALGPTGRLVITSTFLSMTAAQDSYIVTSSDGSSFQPPRLLATNRICPAPRYVGNQLVVAWLEIGPAGFGTAIEVVVSNDDGATFSPPMAVSPPVPSAGSVLCPEIISDGTGALVLYRQGTGGETSGQLVRFDPTTATVTGPVELYSATMGMICADLTAAPDGAILAVVSRGSSYNATDWVTELRRSDDGGATFGKPATVDVLGATSRCPRITYDHGGVVTLAWIEASTFHFLESSGAPLRPCE